MNYIKMTRRAMSRIYFGFEGLKPPNELNGLILTFKCCCTLESLYIIQYSVAFLLLN